MAQAGWLPLSDADSDRYSDGNSYGDGDSHKYGDSDRYIYADGNSHSRLNANADTNTRHDIWQYLLLLQSGPWPGAKCDS